MDVLTALATRRSEHHLTEPAPGDGEFAELLAVAAMAPDHGLLRPWRWILVRDGARQSLGECFAADAVGRRPEEAAAKVLRAPLLATLVFAPRTGHKVPEWEQLAATSAMSHAVMLLLHARGYGSIWRTGAFADSPSARHLLGLQPEERLLGWLYIGTPLPDRPPPPRPAEDLRGRVSSLGSLVAR
jgi:nitroreductase